MCLSIMFQKGMHITCDFHLDIIDLKSSNSNGKKLNSSNLNRMDIESYDNKSGQ